MAQDFAKQRPSPPAARKSGRAAARPAPPSPWNWYISGLVSGVLLTVGGHFGYQYYQAREPLTTTAGTTAPTAQELPAFDFGFYDELATAEVPVSTPPPATAEAAPAVPAATTATTAAPPSTAAISVNYLLQAGSFQERNEAEERRAKITLLNMSAEIVPGVVAGRTWYRVQVGPFAGRPNADEARKTLSANNIDSILLQMR